MVCHARRSVRSSSLPPINNREMRLAYAVATGSAAASNQCRSIAFNTALCTIAEVTAVYMWAEIKQPNRRGPCLPNECLSRDAMPTKGLTSHNLKQLRGRKRAIACCTGLGLNTLRSLLSATTRWQLLPTYVPTLLLAVGAATGGFGDSVGVLVAMGVLTLGLVSFSLLL